MCYKAYKLAASTYTFVNFGIGAGGHDGTNKKNGELHDRFKMVRMILRIDLFVLG